MGNPNRIFLDRLFFALVFYVSVFTGPALSEIFSPKSFILDNGLKVVVVEDTRAPVVTHMVWYKVGSADEPTGASGVAHFLEHLMFKGTEKLEPGEFSQIVSINGGKENYARRSV